ncbi:ATP-binding protein [candidate division KSB1 bacterium]|nr:ATP-binding protein [candidate division KSB1 bacterium]RQW03518.1 MAG: ATP-binding protein [candidate division KSB1 bacterium]
MWIERQAKSAIAQATRSRPVVLLTGARQTGKSSLLRHEFPDTAYVTFDYIINAEEAENNPAAFLGQFSTQVILDEIQNAPSLFRELKIVVDANRETYGRWILTGSRRFSLMQGISESLAGRIGILHLETLSAKELRECGFFPRARLTDFLWQGGFPELWANEQLTFESFFLDYIQTYLARDLQTIINVRNVRDFQRFIRLCAARVGQLLNYSDLATSIGVSNNTIKTWINALEAAGLISLLPPYYANIGKRLIKAPKLYFSDQGLVCALLNINSSHAWANHPNRGELWENFVYMEYAKTRQLVPGQHIFFYRDNNGVEIDFVIEKGAQLELIEAKATERVDDRKLKFPHVRRHFAETTSTVACMINEDRMIDLKNYSMVNPLFADVA